MRKVISKVLYLTIIVLFLVTLSYCKSHKSTGIVYADTSQTVNAIRVNIWQLLPVYNGKFVEIEGVYRHGFEMSALFPNEKSKSEEKAIWIEFTRDLTNLQTNKQLFEKGFGELKKIYNRRIKVVGVFNENNKGHLDSYLGGVENIVSVEIME
jgi:hypothetical protein